MKELTRWMLLAALTISLASCGGRRTVSDDDLSLDGEAPADNAEVVDAGGEGGDEFSDFDEDKPADTANAANAETPAEAPTETPADSGDELSLDDEAAPADEAPSVAETPTEETPAEPEAEAAPAEPAPEIAATPEPEPAPPMDEPSPAPAEPPASVSSSAEGMPTITSIKYRANDNGGTVVIEANGPIQYTSRENAELKQLVVEVPNSVLPKRLQRPLNTRDIQGSIGAIDPYQNSGSSVSRFVIQLREGAQDPVVTQEGNTILVIANAPPSTGEEAVDLTRGEPTPVNVDLNDANILASHSLSDFLAGNTKFYGKRISIEVDNIDVRQALRFITEESGVNMVIADEVRGNISLKLRQVPWDQALVMIMKARRLGYTRSGNVLRIATQEMLKQEEDDATKLAQAKRTVEPLKVRMFPISYAQVGDLEKRVQSFLSDRGKVVGDIRTNSLVVTDIAENMERIGKLVQSLDIQPPQVLIEGKVVEATEEFQRAIGIRWGFNGQPVRLGRSRSGPVNLTPSTQIGSAGAGSAFTGTLSLGTLDLFGQLDATLALHESESKVKVISSPRIVTLTNEPAVITQTQEIPLRQVTLNGAQSQETFTFKPLTLRLEVTPQITADSSIIMKVLLKREFAGAVQSAQNEAVPVHSREANTKVLVRNGETAVIGGIYQNDTTEGESGVPYLRELPWIGGLFRGRTTNRRKNELLLFLTPRVMAQSSGAIAAPPPSGGDL